MTRSDRTYKPQRLQPRLNRRVETSAAHVIVHTTKRKQAIENSNHTPPRETDGRRTMGDLSGVEQFVRAVPGSTPWNPAMRCFPYGIDRRHR